MFFQMLEILAQKASLSHFDFELQKLRSETSLHACLLSTHIPTVAWEILTGRFPIMIMVCERTKYRGLGENKVEYPFVAVSFLHCTGVFVIRD